MAPELDSLAAALADRYEVQRELGQGGMATVYLAKDLKHERQVAIKVLKPELTEVIGAARFLAEIKMTAGLQHPHVLPLHDSGEVDSYLYFVMPYVEGENLQQLIEKGPLALEDAVEITRQVASALGYAHGQGIVHRDVKPANILMSGQFALMADFGIARAMAAAEAERLTQTGAALGTPHYMSPEQGLGDHQIDGRSDQYSLACVLYEMLAGKPPFAGKTARAILVGHAIDPVPPLRTVGAMTSAALDAAIERALAKEPAERFGSIAEFAESVTVAVSSRGAATEGEVSVSPSRIVLASQGRLRAAASTPFVGRGREFASVESLLGDPAVSLISVVGPGGIGKTRLSIEVAKRNEPAFRDGVCYVALDGVESRDGLLSQFGSALELARSDVQRLSDQILSYWSGRSFLLLLDGFDRLLGQSELLSTWMSVAPDSKILLSTREPVAIQAEHVVPLGGMSWETAPALGDGVELFLSAARRRLGDFDPRPADIERIAQICELVDGMPVGIELAAAWVDTLSLEGIANEIRRGSDTLEARTRDVPARQRSLFALIDSTWAQASAADRTALGALSLFETPFTVEACEAVADVGHRGLRLLLDRSLVQQSGPDQFTLSRVLRQQIRQRVEPWPSPDVADRHARFFTDFLSEQAGRIGSASHDQAREELQASLGDIRRAWYRYVEAVDTAALERMASPLRRFFDSAGRYEDARQMFSDATSALTHQTRDASQPDDATRLNGYLLAIRGHFARRLGEIGEAASLLQRAIDQLSGAEPPRELAFALNAFGDVLAVLGRYDDSRRFCERAYSIFVGHGDQMGIAASSNNLGVVAHRLGRVREAATRYEESLEASHQLGDRYGAALALNNLGVLAQEDGDLESAENHYQRARTISVEISDIHGIASALANLARIAYARRRPDKMIDLSTEAREMFVEVGDVVRVCVCDLSLADAAFLSEDTTRSEALFLEALAVAVGKQAEPLIGEALVGLAAIAAAKGDLDRTVQALSPTLQCQTMDTDALLRRDELLTRLSEEGILPASDSNRSLSAVARDLLAQVRGFNDGKSPTMSTHRS